MLISLFEKVCNWRRLNQRGFPGSKSSCMNGDQYVHKGNENSIGKFAGTKKEPAPNFCQGGPWFFLAEKFALLSGSVRKFMYEDAYVVPNQAFCFIPECRRKIFYKISHSQAILYALLFMPPTICDMSMTCFSFGINCIQKNLFRTIVKLSRLDFSPAARAALVRLVYHGTWLARQSVAQRLCSFH